MKKLLVGKSLTLCCLLVVMVVAGIYCSKSKTTVNDAIQAAQKVGHSLIKALEKRDFKKIFNKLYDKDGLQVLKEKYGVEIDDMIKRAKGNQFSEDFLAGFRKALQNHPQLEMLKTKEKPAGLFKFSYCNDKGECWMVDIINRGKRWYIYSFEKSSGIKNRG